MRRGAVRGLVPFGRDGDQLAVAVAAAMSASTTCGQCAGMMQLLAAALDPAFVGELAQHALERGAVGILHAEGARDLAGADFAGLLADEGEELVLGGKGRFGLGTFHENAIREKLACLVHRHDHGASPWRSLVDHSRFTAFTFGAGFGALALRRFGLGAPAASVRPLPSRCFARGAAGCGFARAAACLGRRLLAAAARGARVDKRRPPARA